MRTRILRFGVAAAALALAAPVALPGTAEAATTLGQCGESATVSAGVPDLLTESLIGNPVALNLPILGTPDLFTGPSCSFSVVGSQAMVARLRVSAAAGLVAGQMKIYSYSALGPQVTTLNCGPALGSCERTALVHSLSPSASARCSVSGVAAALASVVCSLETP